MRIVLLRLLALGAATGQEPAPIIDVHMHAFPVSAFGAPGTKACPGDVAKTWPAVDPRASNITPDDLEQCPNPVYGLKTEAEVFETTKRLMLKYNMTGIVSGPEEYVAHYETSELLVSSCWSVRVGFLSCPVQIFGAPDWPWSSAAVHCGVVPVAPWLDMDFWRRHPPQVVESHVENSIDIPVVGPTVTVRSLMPCG